MGLFDNVFISRIKGDAKQIPKKKMAATILYAIAAEPSALSRKSTSLDLSPFTVPAEQVYVLSTEIDCEAVTS